MVSRFILTSPKMLSRPVSVFVSRTKVKERVANGVTGGANATIRYRHKPSSN